MPTQLLDLPPELIEHILVLLSHQDAPTLSACRQTCRALNTFIAQSPLVRYIERAALLGVYDPFVPSTDAHAHAHADVGVGVGETMAMAMTIPERAEALEAWNDAWTTLDEMLCSREPNRRFAMPSRYELRSGRSAEVTSAPRPRPAPGPVPVPVPKAQSGTGPVAVVGQPDHDHGWEEVVEQEVDEYDDDDDDDDDDDHCHFSFGPWFVAAAREGPGVRGAGYSYLDVHANLGGWADKGVPVSTSTSAWGTSSGCCGNKGVEEGGAAPQWTTINVPVRNVVVFALSTELDLAVAISCVSHTFFLSFTLTSPPHGRNC